MSESRPDTDVRPDPGGTPSPGPEHLTEGPVVPGARGDEPKATPGVYAADDAQRERGKAVKPGN
jgi:hypothetical protein